MSDACKVCGREKMPPCPHQSVEAGSNRCMACGKTLSGYQPMFEQGPIPANPCKRGYYADGAFWDADCYRLGYTRELAAREAAALFRVEVALLAAAFEEWSRRCGAAEKDATTRDARYSATVKESIWHEAAGELYRALEKFPETKP